MGPRKGGARRLRSIFNASDWGSAKGMYNYSLMNNASRLLLISHTRPDAATAADGTNTRTCTRSHTHLRYIHTQTDRMSSENYVTGHHTLCVSHLKHMCGHAKHVLTHFSRETDGRQIKRRNDELRIGALVMTLIGFTVREAPRHHSKSCTLSACHLLDNPQYKSMNY